MKFMDAGVRPHNHPIIKVHEAIMGPTWVLSAPNGHHVGPRNLAIRAAASVLTIRLSNTLAHDYSTHCGQVRPYGVIYYSVNIIQGNGLLGYAQSHYLN